MTTAWDTRPIMMLKTMNQAESSYNLGHAADHDTSQALPNGPFSSDDGYIPWEIDDLSGKKMWRRPVRLEENHSGEKTWWRSFQKQESINQVDGLPERFSYKQLNESTLFNGVEDKEETFARVHQGYLRLYSMDISIKIYDYKNNARQALEDFETAISIESKLKHRNLVRLLGWCEDKKNCMLVHEKMWKGSLAKALFGQGRNFLYWPQRFKILTDTATALAYLHGGSKQIVVHRNVQSRSIRLDESFNAKLGNFEIACVVDPQSQPVKTALFSRTGYTSPEYFFTGIVTDKIDVYMFGVVVLEVACGRRAFPEFCKPKPEDYLVQLVSKCGRDGKLLSVVDKRLRYYDHIWMERVLTIGLMCVHGNPHARPSMRSVVQMLAGEVAVPSLSSVVGRKCVLVHGFRQKKTTFVGLRGESDISTSNVTSCVFHDPWPSYASSSRKDISSTGSPLSLAGNVKANKSIGKSPVPIPKSFIRAPPPTYIRHAANRFLSSKLEENDNLDRSLKIVTGHKDISVAENRETNWLRFKLGHGAGQDTAPEKSSAGTGGAVPYGPFTSDDGYIPWEIDHLSGEKMWRRPVRSVGSHSEKKTRWRSCWRKDPINQVEGLPQRFSYRQLKVATINFGIELSWFRQFYSRVYRGVLPSSGIPVVVSDYDYYDVFYPTEVQEDFETAISIESKLKHRNVVRLLGWCEHKKRRMLVHERMEVALAEVLFGQAAEEGKFCLSWQQRFKILTDIAAALAYLHRGSKQIVVHRNVGCRSIFLDEKSNAKLGAFELACVIDPQSGRKVQEIESRFGPLCPEYSRTRVVTDKADVYMFGEMALEVACGRGHFCSPWGSLIDCVGSSFTDGETLRMVDPILREFDPFWMEVVLTIGLLCVNPKPQFRPSMKTVVQMLAGDVAVPSFPSDHPYRIWGVPKVPAKRLNVEEGSQSMPISICVRSRKSSTMWRGIWRPVWRGGSCPPIVDLTKLETQTNQVLRPCCVMSKISCKRSSA